MAFPTYDITKPDPTTQTLTEMAASMRDMETINRAAMVVNTMPGWEMFPPTGGTAPYYTYYYYKRGTEYVRQTVTWGTISDGTGYIDNPKYIDYHYSTTADGTSDNGTTVTGSTWHSMYSTNGRQTFVYTAEGYCSKWTWS